MEEELTRRGRLSAMLIAAAMVVPVLSTAAALVMRHYVLVQYSVRSLEMWLLLDALVLAAGLILRESDRLAPQRKRRSRRR